jgi:hypothetical protein
MVAEVAQGRAEADADAESVAAPMSHLQGKLAKAKEKLAAARVVMAAAHPAAVIHAIDDEDDDEMGFLPNDEDVSDVAHVVREPPEAGVVCRL